MSQVPFFGKMYEFDFDNSAHAALFERVSQMLSAQSRLSRLLDSAQMDIDQAKRDLSRDISPNPIGPIQNAPQVAAAASEYDTLKQQVLSDLDAFDIPMAE